MKKYEILLEVMYYAILEIREEAHEIKNKRIFWLSDLIHNIPPRIVNTEDSEQEIIEYLMTRSSEGVKLWLSGTLSHIKKMEEGQ